MSEDKKECKHSLQYAYCSGRGVGGRRVKMSDGTFIKSAPLKLGFRCTRCGEGVERKATAGERKFHASNVAWESKPNAHAIWHKFVRRFKGEHDKYLVDGFTLMKKVEKWALRYPNDVRVLSIDDSHFASSILVLIEHRTARTYVGTTAVVIPQCTGEAPIEFFMYPDHRDGILSALTKIAAAAKPIEKRESADALERAQGIRKNLRHPAVI